MNKHNHNFPSGPVSDSPIRSKKRSRYGRSSSGSNNPPRFKHHNQSAYQYSQNRNNAKDVYKPNQCENNSNRHFYGNSPKRLNYNHQQQQQNKQSSPYSHPSTTSSTLSPKSSLFSASTQNLLNLPPSQSNTQAVQIAPVMITAQNNQHQQQQFTSNFMDSSNYYGFGQNFYHASYNADLFANTSNTTLGASDGMSPYMWQTITSTPPPKLPQHPPLPNQQPPPILPPLPPSSDMPYLPPPPPIPVSITDSPPSTAISENHNQINNDQDSAAKTIVKMKAKRKAMSTRYKMSKSWSEKDALLALKAEETNTRKLQKDIILIIRFPDPEISREIVKCYSPDIESVHFQLNFAPRYCLVHLKPGTDVEKTIDELSKISFGTGYLSVEIKQIPHKAHSTKLNEVDPFTLYVGNLPTTIACKTLKEHFPGAARIDIGFAQRMKYTRYAFIRYQNVEQAIEAYKRMLDAEIGGRSLTIRFRRLTAATDGNKDGEIGNQEDMDDVLSHTTVVFDNNTKFPQNISVDVPPIPNTEDTNNVTEKHTMETAKDNDNNLAKENVTIETNLIESTERVSSKNCTENETTNQAEKSNTLLLNIKPDPEVDPDDIAVRDNTIVSGLDVRISDIKQEEYNTALYAEFFERPYNQNDSCEKSNRSDINSINSTADETDTMSTLSNNSLGEFLQTCNRRQTQTDNIHDLGPPSTKIIKREQLEKNNIACRESLRLCSKESVGLGNVKQESNMNSENLNTIRDTDSSPQQFCSTTNETVSLSRKQDVATNSSIDSLNNTTNNDDDIVPQTALFFRNDYTNVTTNSINISEYEEFYETRVSSQPSTCLANVKKEPLFISTNRSTNKSNKKMLQNETLNRSPTISNTLQCTESSNINSLTTSHSIDNNDLVPANNLLGTYQPLPNTIKRETEHDDIFSIPFQKTNQLDNAISSRHDSVINSTSPSNIGSNTTEVSKSYTAEENDDDVVIISDNLKRSSTKANSNNPFLTNLFIPKQPCLVSFERKPISGSIDNREVSKLINRYDLDKLFEELDADSDDSDL